VSIKDGEIIDEGKTIGGGGDRARDVDEMREVNETGGVDGTRGSRYSRY
jgi:hypothetical protein